MKTRLFKTHRPLLDVADLRDETDIITISDSNASLADTGVHWDFGTSSSARRIVHSHFKGIKEEDGAQEVATGFPSSHDAEEPTVARYNATGPMARLSIDFPSVASSFAQNDLV